MGQIETTIQVKSGSIACEPRGGHVRARQGTKLVWKCKDEQFSLEFVALDGSHTSVWPFEESVPPQPTDKFVGTLKPVTTTDAPAYKYTVRIGGKSLDPIIIVDK